MSQSHHPEKCSYPTMTGCIGTPVIVRLEIESGFEVVPNRYCKQHAQEIEWNSKAGFWSLMALSLLPLYAGGFALTDRRVPSPVPMSIVFFGLAFGIIAAVWAMRYPMNPMFHWLRRRHARRFLREWTAERVRDDGPFVIENWGECMADEYLTRLLTESQTPKGHPKIMADVLDRLRPDWFDSAYDSLLGAFVNQLSTPHEIEAILDSHRPNWNTNNPVIRKEFSRALETADAAKFNRWFTLLKEKDSKWLSAGLFQDFPDSFHQIVAILHQHTSAATPDVFILPERQGNYGEWPNIWYKNTYKNNYSSDARTVWLTALIELAQLAITNRSLQTVAIDDLRQLTTLANVGFRDTLGSYTEVYQSDPDSYSRDETFYSKGLVWVASCQQLQQIATARLASDQPHRSVP